MIIEGLLTAAALYLIYRVKPELFEAMDRQKEEEEWA